MCCRMLSNIPGLSTVVASSAPTFQVVTTKNVPRHRPMRIAGLDKPRDAHTMECCVAFKKDGLQNDLARFPQHF